MEDEFAPIDIDALFQTKLSPGPTTWSLNEQPLVSDMLEAICRRMDELAKSDRIGIDQAPEETVRQLKEIHFELLSVAQKVRALETVNMTARAESDLQMDLEREAQRRRQF